MASTEDHDHSEYEVKTGTACDQCGEVESACAMCGKPLHKCPQIRDRRLPKGFRVSKEFPEYMVNTYGTVRFIRTGSFCLLVRISSNGGAMINVVRDGKKHTVSAQSIRNAAFPEKEAI